MSPLLAAALLALATVAVPPEHERFAGSWRAWLDSPGGELPFSLQLTPDHNRPRAHVVNGPERIPVPNVRIEAGEITLSFDHYDSRIRAALDPDGTMLQGEWTRTGAKGAITRMGFHAERGAPHRFMHPWDRSAKHRPAPPPPLPLEPRYRVAFESAGENGDPAVLILDDTHPRNVTGTFLTTTGDYRFLAGDSLGELRLSVFDGAHAFLFHARMDRNTGELHGDFWSRDTWHETWTATPDPDARLPDAFAETTWAGEEGNVSDLQDLVFRDLDGAKRSVASFKRPGRPMLVEVFGTWCPNCHDANRYLLELWDRYHDRGLDILGLAFELTGDRQRDRHQVQRYAMMHGITWPILLAGVSDKAEASKAMPVLDRVRSYPTIIFIDAEGRVRWIHTGFTGPATGEAYDRLRARFERRIKEMLSER